MPDESKKDKKKNDPKEQRRPKHSRNQPAPRDRKPTKTEESKPTSKVTVPQTPPVYESPGPEFYKNLKRETDDILKITEEENSKYKKKEIQSNWAKYEMPIDSYEEIEEHDNLGADYEKLIQAPMSIGGHFQFKHEKSWDMATGPSPYDKHFDFNMPDLTLALCTIPFYERNSIDKSLFTESDIISMDSRATRFKQKYFKNKSFSTAETESQDKILNGLSDSLSLSEDDNIVEKINLVLSENKKSINTDDAGTENYPITGDIELKKDNEFETSLQDNKPVICKNTSDLLKNADKVDEIDDLLVNAIKMPFGDAQISKKVTEAKHKESSYIETEEKVAASPADAPKKNPVIESPEDLEKWLDDFLED